MPYGTRLLLERAQSTPDSSIQPRSSRTSAIVNVYVSSFHIHRFRFISLLASCHPSPITWWSYKLCVLVELPGDHPTRHLNWVLTD